MLQSTIMSKEGIRECCLPKPEVKEGFPFISTTFFYSLAGKMFALLDPSQETRGISLWCNPELAVELLSPYKITGN